MTTLPCEHFDRVRGWLADRGLVLPPEWPEVRPEGACLAVDVEQGSAEWWMMRCGLPTASGMAKIITEARADYSAGARPYIARLIAERLLGEPLEWGSTDWTRRGQDMEQKAREWYELETGHTVAEVGFLLSEAGDEGGSPDGIADSDDGPGLLEIKCYGAGHHMEAVLGIDARSPKQQVQALLRLTGYAWADTVYYNPRLPKRIERVSRDAEYIEAMDACMERFQHEYARALEQITAIGDVRRDGPDLVALLKASLAANLYDEVKAKVNEVKFLKYFGIASLSEMPASSYPEAVRLLDVLRARLEVG